MVRQNLAKREEIIQVIQENIDDLRFQERNHFQESAKAPSQDLEEMDGGTEGLDQAFQTKVPDIVSEQPEDLEVAMRDKRIANLRMELEQARNAMARARASAPEAAARKARL